MEDLHQDHLLSSFLYDLLFNKSSTNRNSGVWACTEESYGRYGTHQLYGPLASPAMGHWGTCPPRLPASYSGDHSLYRLWRVMRTVFCPVERFLAIGSAGGNSNFQSTTRKNFKRTNTENVQKQRDFCAIFINFWPIFVIFCPQFSSGSNYSPKMPERSPINFNSTCTSDSGKTGS